MVAAVFGREQLKHGATRRELAIVIEVRSTSLQTFSAASLGMVQKRITYNTPQWV